MLADEMPSIGKRPIGITLLAIAFLWIGMCGTIALCFAFGATATMWQEIGRPFIHSEAVLKAGSHLFSFLWFLIYIAYAIIGFGLWKIRNWARTGLLVMNWLGMLLGLATLPFVAKLGILGFVIALGAVTPFIWLW
jgi:hypothetical protein